MKRKSIRVVCSAVVVLGAAGPGRAADEMTQPVPRHVTPATQEAIARGLDYLARMQGRDGAWRNRSGYGGFPVSMSSLAGLALLMSGSTTTQGPYAPQVDRVTDFLLDCALDDGLIARLEEADGRPMYGHGFSMLYLGQVHGMTADPDRQQRIQQVLGRAVTLTGSSQSTLGGWIYRPEDNSDEGSVTITQLQGLRACRNAGIAVPKEVIDRSLKYLEISFRSDGGIAYRARNGGPSRPPITAAAVCCWYNAGDYNNPMARKALQFCRDKIGNGDRMIGHYHYAHLYYAQACYLSGDPQLWDWYYPSIRDRLVDAQQESGAWDDQQVGEVYATSIALIILQMPYNRLPIMQR